MKKTLILHCPGMVCSPPVVSKCLGEAHRRLGIIYITLHYITLHYITLHYINSFFFHTVGNYCNLVSWTCLTSLSFNLGFLSDHGISAKNESLIS